MAAEVAKQLCQRIGCDAKFTEEDNPEGSCRYHPGPVFHDGSKQWGCCKQRSHDFTMFLALPGCQTGKHTREKPQPAVAPAVPKKSPTPLAGPATAATCSRCKQGFFCSDHGSKLPTKVTTPAPAAPEKKQPAAATAPKIVDLNAKQTCKNKDCGKSFTEKENSETACLYHPGPVVFHDRQRGWECCNVRVTDFDEFLQIPPCTTGWHNANP